MRVLVYWSLSGVGGIQRFNALLTKALSELGLDVTVLMPSNVNVNALRRYHGVNFGGLRNIKVVRYGVVNCHSQYCNLLNLFVGNNVLSELTRHHDLLFLDTLFLRPFHAGTRIVFYLHDRAVMTSKPRPVFTLKPHRLFLQGLLSLGSRYDVLTRRATRVYANSLFTAYLTENALGIRPRVLYPPIDVELIRKYAMSNKEPIVSMLARFSSSKRQDFAIRAFSKAVSICGDEEDLELVLMGAADDLTSLSYVKHLMKLSRELGINKRVRFMVNPSIETVYRVLGKSTAFIHVSPYEPFGIVVAEAMAAGAIPIVHKSGGPWIDIVRMGRYGLGFSNEEEAALGMCRAMEIAKELRDAVMERAREFSYEVFRNRVDAIVRELGI